MNRPDTEAVQGLRAGLAVFTRRPEDILRVAYAHPVRPKIAALVQWAASTRIPCAEMKEADLDRLAESHHHEGLCILARPRRWMSLSELSGCLERTRGAAVALDRVRNPYNVGAILRGAAFLGLNAVLLGAPSPHPGLAPIAVRVAEGGAEHLGLARTTDLADTLGRLHSRKVRIVGAHTRASNDAVGLLGDRPVLLVVGNERDGLDDRVRAQCDAVVAIPGSGRVQSLNVAMAAGILMAEVMRKGRRAM